MWHALLGHLLNVGRAVSKCLTGGYEASAHQPGYVQSDAVAVPRRHVAMSPQKVVRLRISVSDELPVSVHTPTTSRLLPAAEQQPLVVADPSSLDAIEESPSTPRGLGDNLSEMPQTTTNIFRKHLKHVLAARRFSQWPAIERLSKAEADNEATTSVSLRSSASSNSVDDEFSQRLILSEMLAITNDLKTREPGLFTLANHSVSREPMFKAPPLSIPRNVSGDSVERPSRSVAALFDPSIVRFVHFTDFVTSGSIPRCGSNPQFCHGLTDEANQVMNLLRQPGARTLLRQPPAY